MQVRYENEVPAQLGYGRVLGDALLIAAMGYVRWSVTDGSLFDQPCRILKMDGTTKGSFTFKTRRVEYATRNTTTYWITKEGKLLRQSVHLSDPTETKVSECVFGADHIDVSVSDHKGRRSFTVYPSVDLSLVDLQFKPMIVDNKVVLSRKEYLVFEPFNQEFVKYKATAVGTFRGTWLATKFEGSHIDIEGPKGKIAAFVSKEGDLVEADLTATQSLVLDRLPDSKDPFVQKQISAVGKGNR
jgi:hypothetical protein